MADLPNNHLEPLPHGQISEPLKDLFFVTGTRQWHAMAMDLQFSRNMTVVRENGQLTLFNAVRLNEGGLKDLEALGQIAHVVQVGGLHGVDDAFYRERYGASYWAQPGAGQMGVPVDRELVPGGEMPVSGAELFRFETTKVPETVIRLDRDGGVLIACDALQNYVAPDEFFSDESVKAMTDMGFFTPANVGPVWLQAAEPGPEDFARLAQMSFRHVFCGHGAPLSKNAEAAYRATFRRIFDI